MVPAGMITLNRLHTSPTSKLIVNDVGFGFLISIAPVYAPSPGSLGEVLNLERRPKEVPLGTASASHGSPFHVTLFVLNIDTVPSDTISPRCARFVTGGTPPIPCPPQPPSMGVVAIELFT